MLRLIIYNLDNLMRSGQKISHFQIINEIGRGGMGVIYKALDLNLERIVALKFLPYHLNSDKDRKRQFIRKAKAASALDHPNIGIIYEFNETEDNQLFMVMAYYEGETLKDLLQRERPSISESVQIINAIAEGLSAAHHIGIVHRDIKPSNILITQDGEIKIIDFGLAKTMFATAITAENSTKGTIDYMSPEQTIGELVDHRTDIWSLGVLFYEMVAGQLPFTGDYDQAVIYSILKENPKPPLEFNSSIPSHVQNIIFKAMQKSPEKRFADINEMRIALTNNVSTQRAATSFKTTWAKVRKGKKRSLLSFAATVLILVALYIAPKIFSNKQQFVLGVASFWGVEETEISESQRLHANVMRMLTDEFGDDPQIKLVSLPNYALLSEREAESIGKKFNASAIIWGEVLAVSDSIEIQPFASMLKMPELRPEAAEPDPLQALKIDVAAPNQIMMRKATARDVANLGLQAAGTFFSISHPDKAIQLYQKIQPQSSTSAYLIGDACINKNQWNEAKDYFAKAIVLDSTDAKPHVGLARYYVQASDFTAAIEELEVAKKWVPQTWWPANFLSGLHHHLYDFDMALMEAQISAEINPELAEVQARFGSIYRGLEDYENAIRHWENAQSMDPDYSAHLLIAGSYLKMGRIEEARAAAERRFAELIPDREKPNRQIFDALVNMTKGKYADAARLWQYILKEQPDNNYVIGRLGCCYSYDEQVEKAISWWKEAKQRFPQNQWFPHDLGFTYIDIGEYELAAKEFEKALEINPFNQWHYVGLGAVYNSQGLHDQAMKAFERALEKVPENLYLRLYYALELHRLGQYDKARDQLGGVPADPYAESRHYPILQLLLGNISCDQALTALKNIFPLKYEDNLKQAPFAAAAFSEVYYFLAMSYLFHLGKDAKSPDVEKAKYYLEKALAHTNVNDSIYPYIKAELKRLAIQYENHIHSKKRANIIDVNIPSNRL